MPDILPAGLPIQLSAAEAGWIGLGAAIIEVKAALDAAVSEAKGTWTGEAADAFTEWWESRSAPMLELGAACEAVAATIVAAIGETTAANVIWAAAAAAAALAPEVATMGTVVWEGGLPVVEPFLVAAFAPAVADPFTAIAAAAELAECTAAATTTFTLVTVSIATAAAAVTAVGALATGTVGAMVIGVDGDVPQGSLLDTALNVGLPMAGGVLGAGFAAGKGVKALKGAEGASKVAGDAPIPFEKRAGRLDDSVGGGTKARPASDAGGTMSEVEGAGTGGRRASRASDAGDTASDIDDARTPSRRASRADDAGDTRSNLDDARTPSRRASRADDAGDTRSKVDDARTPSRRASRADDAGDTQSTLDDARTPSHRARPGQDAGTETRSRGIVDDLVIGTGAAGAAAKMRQRQARNRLTDVGLGQEAIGRDAIGRDAKYLGLRSRIEKLGLKGSNSAKILKRNDAFLKKEQLDTITDLSKSAAGRDALHRRGFWTDDEVAKFVGKNRWDKWETLSPQRRLQLANHFQDTAHVADNPGRLKALSILAKTDDVAKARIHQFDADQWSKAMKPVAGAGDQSKGNSGVLKRIFGVLQHGDLKHSPTGAAADLQKWGDDVPVATALSHGGRVEMRIPALKQGEDPDAFFKHIFGDDGGKSAGLFRRTGGTHWVEIAPNTEAGGAGKFTEHLGTGAFKKAARDKDWKHYGLDLPVGGEGNLDMAGKPIAIDGRHGHLYIGYSPPSEGKDGVLLIGAETERPWKTNVLGNYHDPRAKSAEMGPAMTHKSDRIGAETDGRIVDLNELAKKHDNWMQQLKTDTDRLTPEQLAGPRSRGRPPKPPRPR